MKVKQVIKELEEEKDLQEELIIRYAKDIEQIGVFLQKGKFERIPSLKELTDIIQTKYTEYKKIEDNLELLNDCVSD